MSPQTLLVGVLLIFVGLVAYSTIKLRNKVHCSFRRVNLTKVEKFVPMHSRYVIFDGAKYKINTDRVTLLWYNRGINQFFPQWVPSLDFSWYSDVPHDPRKFTNTWDTPEARNAASSEEDWKGFNKGMREQIGKKGGFFEQYKTIIIILAVVAVAYLFYSQGQAADARMDMLEQMIRLKGG